MATITYRKNNNTETTLEGLTAADALNIAFELHTEGNPNLAYVTTMSNVLAAVSNGVNRTVGHVKVQVLVTTGERNEMNSIAGKLISARHAAATAAIYAA